VPDATGHRHTGEDDRVDAGRAQHVREVRPVEGARELLHDHVLGGFRRDPIVDLDGLGAEPKNLDGDLVVP
jgi:hypothetical protein